MNLEHKTLNLQNLAVMVQTPIINFFFKGNLISTLRKDPIQLEYNPTEENLI